MRKLLIILLMTLLAASPTRAAVTVSIGIDVPTYPNLQRIPGYPVYYVPRLPANYFFYDGLYWVYAPDGWYVSPWYNGPWDLVDIDSVPLFVLRIPVRYYGYPPAPFRRWAPGAPPRWENVWGPHWANRHRNWQHWNRASTPPPAPLPRYQKSYAGDRYPNDVQRRELVQQHYGHAPRDKLVRQQWQSQIGDPARQVHARTEPARRAPEQSTRSQESRRIDSRQDERGDPRADRHAPPPRVSAVRTEPPRAPTEAERRSFTAPRERAQQRERERQAGPEHAERPEKRGKADRHEDKGNDHDSGKRH